MRKKISIIIPVYNCEKYIHETINSILNQTYKNVELILVNDGSTDNSYKICEEYKENTNVKILNQTNFGAPAARNKGLENATGEYIMFFDSDDILKSDAIEKMVNKIEKEKSDLVIGEVININEDGCELNKKRNYPVVNVKNNAQSIFLVDPFPGNKLYKANIIKEHSISFGNVRIGQDLNFYLKYCIYVKKASFIEDIVSKYRIVSTGISKTYSFKIFDIVESYNDVEKFYRKNNLMTCEVARLLNSSKAFHFYSQLKKIKNFRRIKEKIIIEKYFDFFLKEVLKDNNIIRKDLRKLKLKILYYKTIGAIGK